MKDVLNRSVIPMKCENCGHEALLFMANSIKALKRAKDMIEFWVPNSEDLITEINLIQTGSAAKKK
jgi:hypothetical protein